MKPSTRLLLCGTDVGRNLRVLGINRPTMFIVQSVCIVDKNKCNHNYTKDSQLSYPKVANHCTQVWPVVGISPTMKKENKLYNFLQNMFRKSSTRLWERESSGKRHVTQCLSLKQIRQRTTEKFCTNRNYGNNSRIMYD